jgi:hypothetical protein
MDAAFEHPTHTHSDNPKGEERARQREATIERSMCYRSIGTYWFADPPCQGENEDAFASIRETYPNPNVTLMDDKSQPLV